MASMMGGQPKVIPEFTGLQVNTAVQVLPIPIIYGSPRVDMNLIYYNGFNSQIEKQSGKGILSGGKGGAGQVEYFATILLGIGEGPLGEIQIIYQDQEVWTPETYPTNGFAYYNGTSDQVPSDYIELMWPADARAYRDTAYYGFTNAQLDSSATVPQINLVPHGLFAGTCPLNNSTLVITSGQYNSAGDPLSFIGDINLGDADADPGIVIYDFLTNVTYGAGFPIEWLDTTTLFTQAGGYVADLGDQTVSSFCQAVGLGWSIVLNNVETASSILDRWCKNINTAIVWNGSQLRFIPYWDTYADANPNYDAANPLAIPLKYYNPYTIGIATITPDQILQSENKDEDPITYSRKDPWEVYNTVRLSFQDRTNFFNANPVEAKDEALEENYGPRVDNIGQADEFTLQTYANVSVQMQLRRQAGIRRTYTFKLGPLWGWLDPMDILAIPNPADYTKTVLVRITSAEDDDDENVMLEAEEYPFGVQSPTTIPMSPTTPPNMGSVNSPPSPISQPIMFAPTSAMLTATGFGTPQWIFGATAPLASGGLDTNWGGAYIWVSLDNVSYQLLGSLIKPSIIGSLSSALGSYGGSNPDSADTVMVNLNDSDGALPSVSMTAAAGGASLCVLQDNSGFELFSYTTATLTGEFTYSLTGLYRGLYGTTPRFWGAGSLFMAIGTVDNFFETALLPQYVGQVFYIKAQSFNVFNNAVEDLSTTQAWEYTATGPTPVPPLPPRATQPADYRRHKTIVTSVHGSRKHR